MEEKQNQKINLGYVLPSPVAGINKTRKTLRLLKIFFAVFLLGILILGGIFGYKVYVLSKKIIVKNTENSAPTLKKDISLLDEITPKDLKGEGNGRINILLMGIGGEGHDGPYLTDTMMIASIDPTDREVAILSIPRDLLVPVKNYGWLKINSIYATGQEAGTSGGGAALLKKTLSETLDIPIHYYALMDFAGFTKAIDSINGITVNVPKDIYDPLYPDDKTQGYDPFSIKQGTYLMDGKMALKYARSRETTSDFDRAARQQAIMVAARKKVLSGSTLLSFGKITNLMNILGDHVRTDLQLWELERLYKILSQVDEANISSKILDDGPDGFLYGDTINGMYVLSPIGGDFSRIKKFIHQYFEDPYLTKEKAGIEILNGTTQEGVATTLADELKSLGYNILKVGDAEQRTVKVTTIIDYTGGKKPFTVEYLKNRLKGSEVIEQNNSTDIFDLQIIVGSDYLK